MERKVNGKFNAMIVLLLSLFVFLTACGNGGNEDAARFAVILPDGIGYEVKGDQTFKISRGDDVEFDVEIQSGYIFENTSHGRFENGKLKIEDINTGLTVRFKCLPIATVKKIATNSVITVEPLDERGEFIIGSKASVTVSPFENYYIEEVLVDEALIEDDVNFDGTLKFVIDIDSNNVEIEAVSLGDLYSVTTTVYGNGVIVPSAEDFAHFNDTVDFEFIPDEDNKLSLAMFNGKVIEVEDNLYSSKIHAAISIEAYFIDSSALLLTIFDNNETYLNREYPKDSYVSIPNIYHELENVGGGCPFRLTPSLTGAEQAIILVRYYM